MATKPKLTFQEFYQSIVGKGVCSGCGACVVVCPVNALSYMEEKPVLVSKCNDCGVCMLACGRYRFNLDELEQFVFGKRRSPEQSFGIYDEIVATRSKDEAVLRACQDGGLVSSLLIWAMEKGVIDGAIVSGFDPSSWYSRPLYVSTKEEVLKAAGSRYTYSPNILKLRDIAGKRLKVAYVGTPCQIQSLREMQYYKLRRAVEPVVFNIGLMCHESYTYEGLMQKKIKEEVGIGFDEIKKINIKRKILVELKSGEVKEIALKDARPYVRLGCHYCGDFSSELADISAGGVGATGWTITIVRTPKGREVFHRAVEEGYLEYKPIEEFKPSLDTLVKMAEAQRKRREEALARLS
ncbi:MAG: Coenzyme F420 hydrogenase/dehydrogenase, beta subunit C-terminal domain [Nitrososphaerota archaeon]